MKRLTIYTLLLLTSVQLVCLKAKAATPIGGKYTGTELNIRLNIDLEAETVEVPGMEAFGPMNGYISGRDLYCTWYVSSIVSAAEDKAVVHFSNELGSETQAVELTMLADTLLQMKQIEGSVLKKVVGKKLQKLPTVILFRATK